MTEGAPAAPQATQTPPEGGGNGNVLENLEDVQLTQEQFDQLPGWARESLTKANKEAGGYRSKLRETESLINEVGGADRVKQLHWYASSEEGVKELFKELAEDNDLEKKVGIPSAKLKELLSGAQAAAQQQAATQEAATGEPLSAEAISQLVKQNVQEAVTGLTQQNEQEQLRAKVTEHLKAKGYEDDMAFSAITQLAAKHQNAVPPEVANSGDRWAPYIWALDQGIEDFNAKLEALTGKKRDEYLRDKATDAASTPKANVGSTPASGEKWEPASLGWDELTQEAARRGYFGDLET